VTTVQEKDVAEGRIKGIAILRLKGKCQILREEGHTSLRSKRKRQVSVAGIEKGEEEGPTIFARKYPACGGGGKRVRAFLHQGFSPVKDGEKDNQGGRGGGGNSAKERGGRRNLNEEKHNLVKE